jgi:putative two-component system response regulator
MLRQKALIDSLEEAETILFALAQAVEQRDTATGSHCQRLASLSMLLGQTLGLPPEELTALYRGGFLHDIGKISVPDAILFKNAALTEQEWAIMRKHPLKGEEICRPMKSLRPVLPIIRNHHERWDGSGYPDGLEKQQIPLLARILQIVDIYDALINARPYKIALSPQDAVEIIQEEVRKGWRDPEVVHAFIAILAETPSEHFVEVGLSLDHMRSRLLP